MGTIQLDLHNAYSRLPLIAAVTWYVTLFILLITWLASGRPHYETQEGSIAYISDIGASYLKPLFVIGCTITALSFIATLASERLLQHTRRLPPAQRRTEIILSYCSIGGAVMGGLSLILLSGFDTSRYTTLHRIFLFVFMLGVALSAIFTVAEYRLLSRRYVSYRKLKASYIAKGIISAVLVIMAVIFTVMLARPGYSGLEVAAILEWIIGFFFNAYLITFWYDLRQAAPRDQDLTEIKPSLAVGGVNKANGAPKAAEPNGAPDAAEREQDGQGANV